MGLAILGGVAFFWDGIASLVSAWSRPEYSHGYFIPFIALGLFLVKAKPVDRHPSPTPRWRAYFAILVAGVVLGLIGNLTGIPDIVTYGLIVSIAGLAFIASRGRHRTAILVAVLYLCFMLPLPNFVYWPLSIKLQLLSSEIGVAFIWWFGIPVYLDGNIIDLGVYQLQVAEACSGLRYLFPLMGFGFLIAVFYARRFWQSVVLFLSTVPIAILMNSLRIAVIGVVFDRYGVELADGFLHLFEGWVIFMACLAILGLEVVVLRGLTLDRNPAGQRPVIDPRTLGNRLAWLRSVRSTRPLIASAVTLLVVGFAWQLVPPVSAAPQQRERFSQFPPAFEQWLGETIPLDPDVEAVLGADDYLMSDFSRPVEPP
ncbi:MAG: exosortase, partial [bacterium]|nr:exosortase [bacterium]